MRQGAYATEDELQSLLEDYPELLLGEAPDPDHPVAYLLVRREAGVPDEAGGSDRWFLDHLFLDGQGVPTLVEVKRSTDTRIRREVVGQMLDYAANILSHWPPDQMRKEFEARCGAATPPLDPEGEVRRVSADEYEAYWQRVKTNLEAKRLRLVFVADSIPTPLQTVVEFLNEQLRVTQVLAVQVRRHDGEGVSALTTEVIGQTATAKQAKRVTESKDWDADSAIAALAEHWPGAAGAARGLLDFAAQRGLQVVWGHGATVGTATFIVRGTDGSTGRPFGFSTNNRFDLYPSRGGMEALSAFRDVAARNRFLERVRRVPGVTLPEQAAERTYATFPLDLLDNGEAMAVCLAALDWFLATAGGHDATGAQDL